MAAQTMTLGLAVSLSPPEDASTRLLLQGGMLAATGVVLALLGWPLLAQASRELLRRRLTMELLFVAGIVGAIGVSVQGIIGGSVGSYFDVASANVLLVVYSLGQAIAAGSRQRAFSAVTALTSPISHAERLHDPSGGVQRVPVGEIATGDQVRVMPGELIPVDGRVLRGRALVRQTPFTGEWLSTPRGPGDAVIAGTACEDGTLVVEATAAGSERRIDRLSRLIDASRQNPTQLQRQADRFVQRFLPLVLAVAMGALVYWGRRAGWQQGLWSALAVLLVSCPCAAGLATPVAVWVTMGSLSRRGLILRSGDAVERLASATEVVFDKTGTLSDENLELRSIATPEDPIARATIVAAIAAVERHSTHPVARLLRQLPKMPDPPSVEVHWMRILPGRGIEAQVSIARGQPSILRITRSEARADLAHLVLETTLDGEWGATLVIAERLRESAADAIQQLRALGLEVRVMTGDSAAGARLAEHLAPARAEMSPEAKHHELAAASSRRVLFVGDGVNDAAAMGAAHVSIALASGAPVTVETASATLEVGDLTLIPAAVALARRAVRVIRSNLRWAVAYNAVGITAAAGGWLHPILAAVLMAMSSSIVAWRSMCVGREEAPLARGEPRTLTARPRAFYSAAHVIGLIGQAWILTRLADLPWLASGLVLLLFALAALGIALRRAHVSSSIDMTLGMISLGGLGMNLGWWADRAFLPAAGGAMACCSPSLMGSFTASPWMYFGMLAVGVPAMFALRRTPEVFSWRKWCCTGMLLLGAPGMVLGMWAGAVATRLLPAMGASTEVLAHYALMMIGMVAGMLLPHGLERLLAGHSATRPSGRI